MVDSGGGGLQAFRDTMRSRRLSAETYFGRIFWGLLLIHFPCILGFRVTDVPAYVLIAHGARAIIPLSPRFRHVAVASWMGLLWILVAGWLFDAVPIGKPFVGSPSGLGDSPQYMLGWSAVNAILIWTLLGGVAEYAARRTRRDLATRAHGLRIAYVGLFLAGLLLSLLDMRSLTLVPLVIDAIGLLVSIVLILRLVHRVSREVAQEDDWRRAGADRPWQFSLRTLLLAPLAMSLLLLACFPKLMTGDFCNVRIDKLKVQDDGKVEFEYCTRTSSGTPRNSRSDTGQSCGFASGFPPWPGRGESRSEFALGDVESYLTAEKLRGVFLVEEGRSYRVLPGKPLILYDFKDRNGQRHCSYIEVEPGSRLGF